MTSKEIYEAIDQSKIGEKGKSFLKKAEEKTKGFTIENEQLNTAMNKIYNDLKSKKPEALKDLKVEVKEVVEKKPKGKTTTKKPTKKVIKKVTKKENTKPTKTPSAPKEKEVPFTTRASEYAKKNGITYREAMKKLSEKMRDEEKKATKQASKELESLLKFVRSEKFEGGQEYPKTYGKQDPKTASLGSDAKRKAKPVGKRVSGKWKNQYGETMGGKVYYEYRDNRSDRNSVPTERGKYKYKGKTPPYLEMGGLTTNLSADSLDAITYAKGGNLEVHGLKEGDKIIDTIEGGIQMVKDKNGNIMFVNLANGERSVDVPLPFAKGGRLKSALMRDRKYFNKDESWERAYSKSKNRKGYMADGGEIDAFIMRSIKGVPNTNLKMDAQELKAKFKKGGKLSEDSQYIPREAIYSIKLKDGREFENSYSEMEFLSGAYLSDKVVTEDKVDESQLSLFKKGGKLPKDAIYIKRRDIESVKLEDDYEEKEIKGKYLYNGFWIDPKKQSRLVAEAKKQGRLAKGGRIGFKEQSIIK